MAQSPGAYLLIEEYFVRVGCSRILIMADEDITSLNRKRGGVKAQITRLQASIKDQEEKDFEIEEIKIKLDRVRKLNEQIDCLRLGYYKVVKDEDLDETENNLAEIESDILKLEVSLKCIYNNCMHNNVENSNASTDVKSNSVNIKLPEIPLPKFSGNFEDWSIFKAQFDSLISSNNQLSESQKLYYLQSCLVGSAARIMSTDDSFQSLLKALENRFDNKRLIVNTHIQELLSIEKLHKECAKALRSLIDRLHKHVRALKLLNLDLDKLSEAMLINIVLQKLDRETRKQFEMTLTSSELTDWNTFITFIEKRCQILENLQHNVTEPLNSKLTFQNSKPRTLVTKINNSSSKCSICLLSNHPIYKCKKFLDLNAMERYNMVKNLSLCILCLSSGHKLISCRQTRHLCKICNGRHNYLLHRYGNHDDGNPCNRELNTTHSEVGITQEAKNDSAPLETNTLSSSACLLLKTKSVLLSTAVVLVQNIYGQLMRARVILDSASQSNFVTKQFVDSANLSKQKVNILVSGLGGTSTPIEFEVLANITNSNGSFFSLQSFLVVDKITDMVPATNLNLENIEIPQVMLADPEFTKPSKIDMLLGAETFFEIVKGEQIRSSVNSLIFQNTVFGYVASGYVNANNQRSHNNCCSLISQSENIEKVIEKFWSVENISEDQVILSEEEEFCESHFKETHKRNKDGRFVVKMPMKEGSLGDSKALANVRLNQLVKRLHKNPMMQNLYKEFIAEYENLGHMQKVDNDLNCEGSYYLPHHGVYKPENMTTKLRVVFNASAPSTSGQSLNDLLLAGAVKENIFDIMVRFRTYKYAFTADIKKMYRQILIDESQRNLLKILWKNDINESATTYQLNTVTYGTKSAPFLAIRCLEQLALDEAENFPLAAKTTLNDVYMDDFVSGASTLETAQELQYQLSQMLRTCGMQLHKWKSNSSDLLNSISDKFPEHKFTSGLDPMVKALGIIWNSQEDIFCFKVTLNEKSSYTKRDVLSTIARLYDPLGLIGPIITKAKIFLQRLWIEKLPWDEPLPETILLDWKQFVSCLKSVEDIQINRYVLTNTASKIILRGFSDASESAYGSVVYLICVAKDKTVSSHLIASKSRVAPLKTMSVPRLELSGCLLLSQLIVKVRDSLKLNIDEVFLYTDSTIALAWIKTPAYKLKTFVGNRVSKIQSLTESHQWKHISSSSNPADIISRGSSPQELSGLSLWWHGPEIVEESTGTTISVDVTLKDSQSYQDELKKLSDITLISTKDNSFWSDFLNLSNNYVKLIYILSFIYRFIFNVRNKMKIIGPITSEELERAKRKLIKVIQVSEFHREIKMLKNGESVKKGQVSHLNAFLDEEDLLRVGGRLAHANISYNNKYQILLPKKHRLTILIFQYYHLKNFHVGPQSLLHFVRQEFWPIGGKNIARKVVHNCVTCFRHKPATLDQLMGSLPPERVNPNPVFSNTGVDFCGPFYVRYKYQRKGNLHKVYVAIFVCLATKAIHLEIVFDLTSQAFISCLKRFCSRRGKCSTLFSDNAKTFIGANIELKKLLSLVNVPDECLARFLTTENIAWKFLPPRAPNFGGLWESGVKSFKHHLKRTVADAKLFYEEFLTVVTQVEGILNSRPISPLSSHSSDLEPLTPGHFLIGRPINSIAEPPVITEPDNRLSRWKRLTKMVEQIWKRWSLDYLNHLQERKKWKFSKNDIKENSMVLLKEDNVPPFKWSLGRISQVIPGTDNKIRVVIVKTKNGYFKRPISKICLLPIEN